jgi:hypothetical protein
VLYIAGIVQLRSDTESRTYYRRKRAQAKTSMEAIRCLRRRLSDVVYRQLVADAPAQRPLDPPDVKAGPGGHSGATLRSSATDQTPDVGSSDQPLPGPAPTTLRPPIPTGKSTSPATAAPPRRHAGGVNVPRPTGRTTLTPTSVGAHSMASRAPTP